jgi:hypothetical protein
LFFFVLIQKRKKSRPKNASSHIQRASPLFGPAGALSTSKSISRIFNENQSAVARQKSWRASELGQGAFFCLVFFGPFFD